ncbi:uncharacterized protein LOC105174823 isoform X1 [Sesamum indicum]|uniref:Uncharacterized protein LOC105174823 isoform X1 n=1 Tax=Sesamum indicum TaxID=4182 RepID=A0A6I9U7L7_SESIN|nr:uncharacterized protein LOC105174823 isoform X1 [Sesamum indicum]
MGGHLLSLYSSSQASRIKRLTATLPISICRVRTNRYSEGKQESINTVHGGVDQERAPSTAQEFKRVAEEKARQGFASQTVEKAQDGAEEAVVGDSTFESVKEAYKEAPAGDFRKTGDER